MVQNNSEIPGGKGDENLKHELNNEDQDNLNVTNNLGEKKVTAKGF